MADEKTDTTQLKIKTVTNQVLNIHQRVQAVKKEVKTVFKTKEVKAAGQGSYMAVTHDEVTKLLHEPMTKHGINCIASPSAKRQISTDEPMEWHVDVSEVGKSSKGTPKWRFSALFMVDFVNVDNPKDKITMPVFMHADDFGDKAPGKALSMAVKVAKLKVFDLESGDNEEERIEERDDGRARRITAEEAQQLRNLIEQSSGTEEQLIEYIKQDPMMRGFEKIEDMYLGVWERWVKYLQEQNAKNQQ